MITFSLPTLTALLLNEPSSSTCRPEELADRTREFCRSGVGGVLRRSQSCLASSLQGAWEDARIQVYETRIELKRASKMPLLKQGISHHAAPATVNM